MSDASGTPLGRPDTGGPPTQTAGDDDNVLTRARALALIVSSLGLVALGAGLYRAEAPSINLVTLQVAGSASVGQRVVGTRAAAFGSAIHWDFALMAGYGLGLALACVLGTRVLSLPRSRALCWAGVVLTAVAVAANVVQDLAMLAELPDPGSHTASLFRIAQGLSFLKFSALSGAAVIGVGAWTTSVSRLVRSLAPSDGQTADGEPIDVIPPPPHEVPTPAEVRAERTMGWSPTGADADAVHWERREVPPGRPPADVGICVSGGGVRAATVALGALQALREAEELQKATYLVSVSGGGYMAGAFQLLLASAHAPSAVANEDAAVGTATLAVTPKQAFAPGSAEEDHTRRHSSYLSDGLRQWVVALAVLFRNLLLSFALGALAVGSAGIAVAALYRATRIANLSALTPHFVSPRPAHLAALPTPTVAVGVVLAVLASLTLLMYIASAARTGAKTINGHQLHIAVVWLRGLTAIALVVGVAIPWAVWASAWVTWNIGFATSGTVAAAGTVTGLAGYLGTVATIVWRKRATISTVASDAARLPRSAAGQVLPSSMLQMLILWVCLIALALLFLMGAGWVAASRAATSWWSLIPLGLYAAAWLGDQTWMSLHPFYRRRLASAFAVRRVQRNGRVLAEPFDYILQTRLSEYAEPVPGFPRVIFAATANITGQDITPPGRRAVSYTLSSDYVGGPDVGWIRTKHLEDHVSPHLRRDLTVEAAVAISGAAFAAALGAQTRFYEIFPRAVQCPARSLAAQPVPGVARVDEPTGLDHPAHSPSPAAQLLLPRDPRPPSQHQPAAPLHRRRPPRESGPRQLLSPPLPAHLLHRRDRWLPPLATTLAQAITSAREELGVQIVLDDASALKLVPGAGPLDASSPLAALNPRLSDDLICTGTISYPARPGDQGDAIREGELVFAKTGLVSDLPYELLAYAVDNSYFPRDSTADQWFNWGQFDAYQQLGHEMGRRAAKAQPGRRVDLTRADHDQPAAETGAAAADTATPAADTGAPAPARPPRRRRAPAGGAGS